MTIGAGFDAVLAAAKQGQEWAWEELYRDLSGPIHGYLRGRGAADPEDAASETFLHVSQRIGGFEGDERAFKEVARTFKQAFLLSILNRDFVNERAGMKVRFITFCLEICRVSATRHHRPDHAVSS